MYEPSNMFSSCYYETWSARWTDTPGKMDLANIDNADVVNIAFVLPGCRYALGQKTFENTGLNFSQDFQVVHDAIQLLRKKAKVMLSVGGASYSDWSTFNPIAIWSLKKDLGCDGIDIDWEGGAKDAAKLTGFVKQMAQFKGPYLSIAAFSTGAYTDGEDWYSGVCIPVLKECGASLSWINIMAYGFKKLTKDAGKDYDPIKAFAAYRKLYKGRIFLGCEIGVQGWGNALLTYDNVHEYLTFLSSDSKPGIFVWAYYSSAAAGLPKCKDVLSMTKLIKTQTTDYNL